MTPTENENEQRDATNETSANSQSGSIVETTRLTAAEAVPIDSDKSPTEMAGRFEICI